MLVCSHGYVKTYCNTHDMLIMDTYDGDIENYDGICRVLVTDREITESEYYTLKGKMLARGVELVSIHHKDTLSMCDYLVYTIKQSIEQRQKYIGRCQFGFKMVNGEKIRHTETFAVAKRIIELRDKGLTLAKIQDDPEVKHPDGRKLSLSTINTIIKNRKDYE